MAMQTIAQNERQNNLINPNFTWNPPKIKNSWTFDESKEYGKEAALCYIKYSHDNPHEGGTILSSLNIEMSTCCNLIAQQAFFKTLEVFWLQEALEEQKQNEKIIAEYYAKQEETKELTAEAE